MKKKCLGCAKIFEDKISICQDCFNAVEKTRKELTFFPQGFRKKSYLVVRGLDLGVAAMLIITNMITVSLFSLTLIPLATVIMKSKHNYALFLTGISLPMMLLFMIGLGLGNFLQRAVSKRLIKQWSDKQWYSVPIRSWQNTKYWLPTVLPFIILVLFLWPAFYILKTIILNSPVKSVYIASIYLGLGFGLRILFGGFLIGLALTGYHSLDWIDRLSK